MEHNSKLPLNEISVERRFQLLVESVHDYAIYMLDPDGYVESWNKGAQQFKGYSAGEIIGQHFSRFYMPEDRAASVPAKALHTALTEGKYETEGWCVRKDGTRFWALVVIDPVYDPSGRLVGFATITRDITERKSLQQSEEHFKRLVQGVTDYAIYMLSPEGKIVSWNPGAERIKGYSAEDVVDTHFSRFYTEDDRANGMPGQSLETAAREGRFEREGWRVRKDGSKFWAHVVIDAIRDSNQNIAGFAKITRDITERREAAEALELTRAELAHSQKLEAVGKLTGGVAHDFNNLLQVIVNSLNIISREIDDPRLLKVLDSAERAAGRGALLTQQLLAFSRQQPLKQAPYDINTLIRSIEGILRRASQETVDFSVTLGSKLKSVMLDAPQFEAVLLNLVVNARDAMPRGGSITVSTSNVILDGRGEARRLTPGAYVKVTVADTGTGMTADVAQRAVEPFFTTKGPGKGSGLGLSHVYGFVKQSGGDIVIQSEVGKGTAISLYLPVTTQEASGVNVDADADADADSPAKSKRDKVLIVEDESDVLEVTVELFRGMDYEIITADNGMKAIDILKRNRDIDVLFTDVVMPGGMNGIDLARFTQKLCPGVKVVLTSGYPAPALVSEHGSLDDFSFIRKPYRWSELLETLRGVAASS